MAKNKLFNEFPAVPTSQWEEKIMEDLKGADYDKKLIWDTIEGIKVNPCYSQQDIKYLNHIKTLPCEFPFVRGKKFNNNNWLIHQDIAEANPEQANKKAVHAIEKGNGSIRFDASRINEKKELSILLKNIDLTKTSVCFGNSIDYTALSKHFANIITENKTNSQSVNGSLDYDPIGLSVFNLNFAGSENTGFNETMTLINTLKDKLPNYRIINIKGSMYHEAGASIVQELVFSLAHGNEYLARLTDEDLSIDDIAPRIQFTLAVGSDYFLEISKLRAVKMLWANIIKQYKPSSATVCQTFIHGVTSFRNKTIYDPYVNLLRSASETMAAAIGGIDAITVRPFDSTFKDPGDFSQRMARNQQLILKHEAYFNEVADPAAGSYYIEKLTDAIASHSWKLFQNIENNGGFIKSVKKGFIFNEIEKTCLKRDMNIAMRKQVFIGTSQYPNLQEEMLEKIKHEQNKPANNGLKQYRDAMPFESIRLATEKHKQKGLDIPKVFLFTYGNLAMRKARANFMRNFFGCAGYEIIENTGFDTIENGIEAAINSGADIIVLCSSDDEYKKSSEAVKQIKIHADKKIIIIAGYPKDIIEKLKEAGVDDFIHIRTNVIEKLSLYNQIFGIK